MLDVSKVDGKIETVLPRWHFEGGEKWIEAVIAALLKAQAKYNHTAITGKHFKT